MLPIESHSTFSVENTPFRHAIPQLAIRNCGGERKLGKECIVTSENHGNTSDNNAFKKLFLDSVSVSPVGWRLEAKG